MSTLNYLVTDLMTLRPRASGKTACETFTNEYTKSVFKKGAYCSKRRTDSTSHYCSGDLHHQEVTQIVSRSSQMIHKMHCHYFIHETQRTGKQFGLQESTTNRNNLLKLYTP